MTIPVTLVAGFLGAGKTTLINRLLRDAGDRRVAAIVNDFGAINIDADMIAESTGDVIGLKNGCICCSLQGDLLRTLKQVVSREEGFDHIVIEASGVSDPYGIIETLMDPVFRQAVRLDAVVTVVDVEALAERPELRQDRLWQAQIAAADFLALSKTEGAPDGLRNELAAGKALVFDSSEPLPLAALLAEGERAPAPAGRISAERFGSVDWTWQGDIPLERFQACVQDLAPSLVRAKGILNFAGRGETSFVFQLVGRRAEVQPAARRFEDCRLVLIGEKPRFDAEHVRQRLVEAFINPEILAHGG